MRYQYEIAFGLLAFYLTFGFMIFYSNIFYGIFSVDLSHPPQLVQTSNFSAQSSGRAALAAGSAAAKCRTQRPSYSGVDVVVWLRWLKLKKKQDEAHEPECRHACWRTETILIYHIFQRTHLWDTLTWHTEVTLLYDTLLTWHSYLTFL